MAFTAREWLLLPKDEQKKRGKELSPEECLKLRMELSEVHITEEEKKQLTEEQRYNFINPKKSSKEDLERSSRGSFAFLQDSGMLPKDITWEEWVKKGRPLNWRNTEMRE